MSTQEQRAKHAEKMRRYRAEHPEYVRKGREALAIKRKMDPKYAQTPPGERQRQRAEYMQEWRHLNPGRQSKIDKAWLQRWKEEHPEAKVGYHTWWRKHMNPESVKRSQLKRIEQLKEARAADPEPFRAKDRAARRKFDGLPETHFHGLFAAATPAAFSLDRIRPDFYVPGDGFIEIKVALPMQAYNWRHKSEHFPELFFRFISNGNKRRDGDRRTVDGQIALSPRPLLVIVYNPLTGEELARKAFE